MPNPLLFEINNKEYNINRITNILKKEFLIYLNIEFNINIYRYLIIYIIKNRIKSNYYDSIIKNNHIENKLANYNIKITNQYYARDKNVGFNLNKVFEIETKEFHKAFLNNHVNDLMDFY